MTWSFYLSINTEQKFLFPKTCLTVHLSDSNLHFSVTFFKYLFFAFILPIHKLADYLH